MKQTARRSIPALLTLCLVAFFVACGNNSAIPEVGTIPEVVPTLVEAPAVTETASAPATTAPASTADACSIVSVAEIQEITGVTYDSATSQGNFPNLKHCEYRGQANVVSLVLATGSGATDRLAATKQLAHTPIADFEDEALWEPVQNLLSVMSDGRLVEVRISRSHGDEATRIQQAQALALVMLSR